MYKPLAINSPYLINNSAVGQIERTFWEYLYEKGFRPTIIHSESNKNDVPQTGLNCELLPSYDNQFIRLIIAFLKRSLAEDFAHLPDYNYFSWAKVSAIEKAKQEANSGRYDYIHSTCLPFSCHLIAYEAKKVSGLPWIASFYDPWFDNPYRPFKFNNLKERDRNNEATVAKYADAILHSNYAIYNEWVERYGEGIKKKMYVVPFVFKPATKEVKNRKKENNRFIITHIGSLYPGRNSTDFLKAIRILLDEHPELFEKIEIKYIGTVTEEDRQMVSVLGLSELAHFVGRLNEKECEPYFEEADLFFAIDGKDARNIFFPSKVLKYFYYGKPILGLTPDNSALQFELRKSNNYSFTNENYHGIATFLFRAITEEGFPTGHNNEYWKNFTMERVYPQYLEIVNNVLKLSRKC